MRSVLTVLVFCLVSGAINAGEVLVGDDFTKELGLVDPVASGREPELVAQVAPPVISVDQDSPAQAMGMQVGDRLIGLDGLVVVGSAEWNLVRYRHVPVDTGMRITVLRDYRVIDLITERVLPLRKVGFNYDPRPNDQVAALVRIGFSVPESSQAIRTFPPRAALALLRWHANHKPEEPTAWIAGLGKIFTTLTEQRWQAAADLADLQIPDSCPEMRRLERFYRALAQRHAKGEQPPTLVGESLIYFSIHYPYPPLVLPPFGAFTHPDAAFVAGLQDRIRHSWDVNHDTSRADDIRQVDQEEDYAFRVRLALLDPQSHGGWPFRHQQVVEARAPLLTRLRQSVTQDNVLTAWNRFALTQALMVDVAQREDGIENMKEVFSLVASMREQSPLLGYLALSSMTKAAKFWNHQQVREGFRQALLAGPLPDAEPPSGFLAYVRTHEASLTFIRPSDDEVPLVSQIDLVYAAMSRTRTFVELHQLLAANDLATRPQAERLALMAQMLDYVTESCQPEDLQAMARLDLPGALTDAIAKIAHWHARKDEDVGWFSAANESCVSAAAEQATAKRLVAGLAEVPWSQAGAVPAAIEGLRLRCGTPQVTMRLAAACDAHGHADLAEALRKRIANFYEGFAHLEVMVPLHRRNRMWIDFLRLRTYSPHSATVNLALTAGERYVAMLKDNDDWDSTWLHLAHAHLLAGNRDEALAWLGRSMATANQDKNAAFFVGDQPIDNCREFRTWLLGELNARQTLNATERQRLVGQTKSDMVDERFAALLGVEHKALTGSATAPGANDF